MPSRNVRKHGLIVVRAKTVSVAVDRRARGRAAKQDGPRWPLAYQLAMLGTPIGVWLVPLGGDLDVVAAVTTDMAGELVELRRLPRARLVRWCLNRHLRVHHRLGELVEAQIAGRELGWIPGRIVEVKGALKFIAPSSRFDCVLPGEVSRPGAVVVQAQALFEAEL